ncbi:MAG: hypothetical protein RLN89_14490 [Parvibaculum sp.]
MTRTFTATRMAITSAFIGLFLIVNATSSQAEDRRVRIINETQTTMVEFYASNVGAESWQEDILGQDILAPGDSVMMNIDDGTGYCLYDFRAVFTDGDVLIRERVDVCSISSYRYHN